MTKMDGLSADGSSCTFSGAAIGSNNEMIVQLLSSMYQVCGIKADINSSSEQWSITCSSVA